MQKGDSCSLGLWQVSTRKNLYILIASGYTRSEKKMNKEGHGSFLAKLSSTSGAYVCVCLISVGSIHVDLGKTNLQTWSDGAISLFILTMTKYVLFAILSIFIN